MQYTASCTPPVSVLLHPADRVEEETHALLTCALDPHSGEKRPPLWATSRDEPGWREGRAASQTVQGSEKNRLSQPGTGSVAGDAKRPQLRNIEYTSTDW